MKEAREREEVERRGEERKEDTGGSRRDQQIWATSVASRSVLQASSFAPSCQLVGACFGCSVFPPDNTKLMN